MKKFFILLLFISFCGGSSEIAIVENTSTTSKVHNDEEEVVFNINDYSWDELYPLCSDFRFIEYQILDTMSLSLDVKNSDYILYSSFVGGEDYEFLKNEFLNYCEKNFTYEPMEEFLWSFSANWMSEIVLLNYWTRLMNKMCLNLENECKNEGSIKNFSEFKSHILGPAFEIDFEGDSYLCYLHTASLAEEDEAEITNKYIDYTGRRINRPSESPSDNEINIVGNTYIKSSVLFPKPIIGYYLDNNGEDYYKNNPTSRFTYYNDLIKEPLYLWDCLFQSNNSNGETPKNSQWIIYGYGPPFVRATVSSFNTSEVELKGNYYMWSVVKPGPNSVVEEYKITKLYWFNEDFTTIKDFCSRYSLDKEYLNEQDIDYPFLIELKNKEYVNSYFCSEVFLNF